MPPLSENLPLRIRADGVAAAYTFRRIALPADVPRGNTPIDVMGGVRPGFLDVTERPARHGGTFE
jgi:hypothetical protein